MIYKPEIFTHDWQHRNFALVAAYCCMMADSETGELTPLEGLSIMDHVAVACDLGRRRTINIMGHLREVGLLRYESDGRWGLPADQARVFVVSSWSHR